jgi:membrane protease YdiL (CAAX protease family)
MATNVFFGPRRLRAGWRFAIFVAILFGFQAVLGAILSAAKVKDEGFAPGPLAISELVGFVILLVVTSIMLRIDRRSSLAAYGIALRGAVVRRFGAGFLWGLLAVAAIVGAIAACGGVHYAGFRYSGAALAGMVVLWLLANLGIGLSEELLFRGYPLRTLSDGLGFWPGAILLSLIFGALHFFTKPFETWVDFASVGLIGLFLCFALRRTGDLSWAIGFHAGFDFAQLGLFAGPNSGNGGVPVAQSLLVPSWSGPQWLTGGKLGIEASLFVFPVIALLYLLFGLSHRQAKFPPPEA